MNLPNESETGSPIPDSPHAVSVSLPRWQDNIGYEEGDPDVVNRMQLGYPRFFVHPLVRRLFELPGSSADDECSLVFPSRAVAERCVRYVAQHESVTGRIEPVNSSGVFRASFPSAAEKTAQSYWQHTGEIVSSRAAELFLNGEAPIISSTSAKQIIRERIAAFSNSRPEDVFLFHNGMAAIFTAWRMLTALRPDRRSVQFGFPYVDSLKIQQRFPQQPNQVLFLPNGDQNDLDELSRALNTEEVMGLFCEFPCNPLLVSPDLNRLRELADERSFPLVVDDTLGAHFNINVLPAADVTVTSLTKYFSGYGDVMGGAMVLNPQMPFYESLRQQLDVEFEDLLYDVDADVLEQNSRDVQQRVGIINRNAQQLCEFLQSHPLVDRIYFPEFVTTEEYNAFRCPDGGYGGLFSLLLKNPSETAPAVFDRLDVARGPNLGTSFTLASPYVLLAHYDELDFVERHGISRYLIRVSVGVEDIDWLKNVFGQALDLTR